MSLQTIAEVSVPANPPLPPRRCRQCGHKQDGGDFLNPYVVASLDAWTQSQLDGVCRWCVRWRRLDRLAARVT